MSDIIVRPEKITKFLSHMFPTEQDRIYFELVTVSFENMSGVGPNRIELEMPNNDFLTKYIKLKNRRFYTDANTPDEIHAINIANTGTIKTKLQQSKFIYRLYGSAFKTPNTNSYIIAVKKSLCKDNNLFKSYSLTNYNEADYEFTDEESEEYNKYIQPMIGSMCAIRDKYKIYNLERQNETNSNDTTQ